MKTKLVYVVSASCCPSFIEEACVSAFSARYHNPDAHIAIITDDYTEKLFAVGGGKCLLELVNEVIVIPFTHGEDSFFRSRWMKTNIRNLIDGDLLYIDTDTIITHYLYELDNLNVDIAAVPDYMTTVSKFRPDVMNEISQRCGLLGIDVSKESFYFNGGVIFYKDSVIAHTFSTRWNSCYCDNSNEIKLDQPSLCRTNIEMGRLIVPLDDFYNYQMFVHPQQTQKAFILHFASFSKRYCWLFSPYILKTVCSEGISNKYLMYGITHPSASYLPFASELKHKDLKQIFSMVKYWSVNFKQYSLHIEPDVTYYKTSNIVDRVVAFFLRKHFFWWASFIAILSRWVYSFFIH